MQSPSVDSPPAGVDGDADSCSDADDSVAVLLQHAADSSDEDEAVPTAAAEAPGDPLFHPCPDWRRTMAGLPRPHQPPAGDSEKYASRLKADAPLGLFATPLSSLKALFTDDLLTKIAEKTSTGLLEAGLPATSVEELSRYIGLTIAMGLKRQPSVHSYWNTTDFGERRCCAWWLPALVF